VLHTRLIEYFTKNNLLSRQQYGFRNNHSTSLAITDLYENLLQNLDKKLISCAVFLDLRKSFDSVNNSILLTNLEHYGVRGNAFKLIQLYFFNRKQYVQKGNTKSSSKSIISRVPQGSILGLLFVLLFINDLPNSNFMKAMLFANDTVLVQSDNNLGKLQNSVNREMTKVVDWLTANKLSLNLSKTKYLLITNKHLSTESFAINANVNHIERTLI